MADFAGASTCHSLVYIARYIILGGKTVDFRRAMSFFDGYNSILDGIGGQSALLHNEARLKP